MVTKKETKILTHSLQIAVQLEHQLVPDLFLQQIKYGYDVTTNLCRYIYFVTVASCT